MRYKRRTTARKLYHLVAVVGVIVLSVTSAAVVNGKNPNSDAGSKRMSGPDSHPIG